MKVLNVEKQGWQAIVRIKKKRMQMKVLNVEKKG